MVDEEIGNVFDGKIIQIDVLFRQAALLNAPLQPLCREDCPGIPIKSVEADEPAVKDSPFKELAQLLDQDRFKPTVAAGAREVDNDSVFFHRPSWCFTRLLRGENLKCHCRSDDILISERASDAPTISSPCRRVRAPTFARSLLSAADAPVFQYRLDHHACPECGFYDGKKAIKVKEFAPAEE